MADSNESKDETIHVDPPPLPMPKSLGQDAKSRDTVRIQLPLRQSPDTDPSRTSTESPPASKPAAEDLSPSPPSPAPPEPPPPVSVAVPPVSVTAAPSPLSWSPNKETARIPRMPDPPAKPPATVQMKKTQPLIAMPHAAPAKPSIVVAAAENKIMPLCWVLLGVSAVILTIQIWIYLS